MKKVFRVIGSSLLVMILFFASFSPVQAEDALTVYLSGQRVLPDGNSLVSGKTVEITAGEIITLFPSLDGGKNKILTEEAQSLYRVMKALFM